MKPKRKRLMAMGDWLELYRSKDVSDYFPFTDRLNLGDLEAEREAALDRLRNAHAIQAGLWDEQHDRQHTVNTRLAAERDEARRAISGS